MVVGSLDIRVNNIDYRGSIVDGPGVRTVIFLQGCVHSCKGCHNPSTWNPCQGIKWDVNELANEVMENSKTNRITISGGEPLLQMNEVIELVSRLVGCDLAIYTGFEIEQIPSDLIDLVNYIKVGPYIEDMSTSVKPYVGSSNQQFLPTGVTF